MNIGYRDIQLYKQLHKQKHNYGGSGHFYFEQIKEFIKHIKPNSILDFGSGKGSLGKLLMKDNIKIDEYDPAIEGKEIPPRKNYDMLISTDVLEHLYEDELDLLFQDMLSFESKYMYHVVSNRAAYNKLPDGSNAHKTVKDSNWWLEKMKTYFQQYKVYTISFNKKEQVTHYKLIK